MHDHNGSGPTAPLQRPVGDPNGVSRSRSQRDGNSGRLMGLVRGLLPGVKKNGLGKVGASGHRTMVHGGDDVPGMDAGPLGNGGAGASVDLNGSGLNGSRVAGDLGAGGGGEALVAASQAERAHVRVARARAFERLRVDDVMVPRADVIAVDISSSVAELLAIFSDAAHSRLPVYRDTLDDPVGMVHIKDVVKLVTPLLAHGVDLGDVRPLDGIMHRILAVPASMRAPDLLVRMQTRRIHMAVVADEFGGTDGLVTLEDLVEAIVGDIADEHDDPVSEYIRPRSATCWEVDARAPIEQLESALGASLEIEELTDEVDTLGGLVFTLIDRVPERGELIAHPAGLEFEVTDADPRRIKRLLVRVAAAAGDRRGGGAHAKADAATDASTDATTGVVAGGNGVAPPGPDAS